MLLRRPATVLLLAMLLLGSLLGSVGASAATSGQPSSGSTPVTAAARTADELFAEAVALRITNEVRTSGRFAGESGHGDVGPVKAVQGWTDVTTVARAWSDTMTRTDTFRHNPDYHRQYGYWRGAGENIGWSTISRTSAPTRAQIEAAITDIMAALWHSDGHRRNWMNGSFDDVGIGVDIFTDTPFTDRGDSATYWLFNLTINFRDRSGSVPSPWRSYDHTNVPNEAGTSSSSKTTSTKPAGGARFSDVPTDHTFHGNVERLATSGITSGCGNGRFCPDARVTRGQMAAFLVRALDLPAGRASFSDARGHLFEKDIAALADAGITSGCGNGRFCPDDLVTRGQMAAFLVRALELPAGRASFSDTRGHLFEKDVAALADAGITRGCGKSTFCPSQGVTRAQMAAFLDRAGLTD